MKAFTTFAILLPILGYALAGAPMRAVICSEFNDVATPDTNWEKNGSLNRENKPGSYWSAVTNIKRSPQGGGPAHYDTDYRYTISGGIVASTDPKKPNPQLFAMVERSTGKGVGQQFRVNFWDAENGGNLLGSYWAWPNEHCTIDSPIKGDQVKRISVWSRTA